MGTEALSRLTQLNTSQLTSLSDEATNAKPNLKHNYYIAFEVPTNGARGNVKEEDKLYKFVPVKVEKGKGQLATSAVKFHSTDLGAQGFATIKKRAMQNGHIAAKTYQEFQNGQQDLSLDNNGSKYHRKGVVIPSQQANLLSHGATPPNGYDLVIAVERSQTEAVRQQLTNGAYINGIVEGHTPLSAAINVARPNPLTVTERSNIISELLKYPGCDPTLGKPTALELACKQGEQNLLKILLEHSVKSSASPRRVSAAVNFCLTHCPEHYFKMSVEMNKQCDVNKKVCLTNTPPELFNSLLDKQPAVAAKLFTDMSNGCLEQHRLVTQASSASELYRVPEETRRGWQTCYNFGCLLQHYPCKGRNIDDSTLIAKQLDNLKAKCTAQNSDRSIIKLHLGGVDSHGKTALIHAVEFDEPVLVRAMKETLQTENCWPEKLLEVDDVKRHYSFKDKFLYFIFRVTPKGKRTAIDFVKSTTNSRQIKSILTDSDVTTASSSSSSNGSVLNRHSSGFVDGENHPAGVHNEYP